MHKRLTDTIGQGQNPTVDLAVLVQLSHLLGRQVLIDDVALGISLELLAGEFSGRYMSNVHVGVLVEQIDQGLACIAAGANEANAGRHIVGGMLLARGRVRVGRDGIGQTSRRREGTGLGDGGASTEGGRRHRREGDRGRSWGDEAGADAHGPRSSTEHGSNKSEPN